MVLAGVGVAAAATATLQDAPSTTQLQTQLWGLMATFLFTGLVTAGMTALAWRRLAAAIRRLDAVYGPVATGSVRQR